MMIDRVKLAASLVLVSLIIWSGGAVGASLSDASKAPDWGKASQSEKDAWIAAYKITKAGAAAAGVAACLDEHAGQAVFATNALSGVTKMCESIAALPE